MPVSNFERRLGSKIKDDKKSFFAYARCRAKTKIRVGPLVSPDGKEIKDLKQVAEKFNDQFSSVFTAENVTDIPVSTSGDKLCDIIFTEEEVLKRLLCLWDDKSARVGEMSSRFLKAVCHEITVPVTLLFNLSMSECKVPHDWKLANFTHIYINMEAE